MQYVHHPWIFDSVPSGLVLDEISVRSPRKIYTLLSYHKIVDQSIHKIVNLVLKTEALPGPSPQM